MVDQMSTNVYKCPQIMQFKQNSAAGVDCGFLYDKKVPMFVAFPFSFFTNFPNFPDLSMKNVVKHSILKNLDQESRITDFFVCPS